MDKRYAGPLLGFLLTVAGCSPSAHGPSTLNQPASSAVDTHGVRFTEATQQSGINYHWVVYGKRPLNILQTIGNGCAFLDYNNDGNLDILLVGPKVALYRGDGHGHFTDVSRAMGLDKLKGDFRGCAVGDYDNDGYDDIYLSAYNGGVLLHNEHGTSFKDVTEQAGIKSQPWGSSCAFVDTTGAGRLDLVIGNYVDFKPGQGTGLCPNGEFMTACGPLQFAPLKPALYHNLGGGRFADVTKQWGLDSASGNTLGVATADFDGSGRQGIAMANDEQPGDLFKFDGHRFTDIGSSSGTAYDASANRHAGMGVDWGDYDNDGKLDLVVTTYQFERKCVYHNDGNDLFTERSNALGLAEITVPWLTFGVKWVDVNNDGWLDLLMANGHVEDNVNDIDKTVTYRQPTKLLYNNHGQSFSDFSSALIGTASRPIVGRGLAVGDYDNDGRMDALVVDSEGTPLLLHNDSSPAGHWLEVRLVGTKSNRDGLGALLTAVAGGQSLLRQCTTGGSYASASDKRVHFGLGDSARVDSLTIKWPSGRIDTLRNIPADQIIAVTEGKTD